MKKIRGVSPSLDEHTAVFPDDTACSQRLHFALAPGCPVNDTNTLTLSRSTPGRTPVHAILREL